MECAGASVRSLVTAARGFAACFWGLALSLAALLNLVTIHPLARAGLSAHAFSTMLWLGAAWLFLRCGDTTPGWHGAARRFAFAAGLQVYLLPFLGWWHQVQQSAYWSVNAALLAGGMVWLLTEMSLLGLCLARRTGDHVLQVEVRLSLWTGPLLALLALALYLAAAWWLAAQMGGGTLDVLRAPAFWNHPLSHLPAGMPLVMGLAVAWEVKERCLSSAEAHGHRTEMA